MSRFESQLYKNVTVVIVNTIGADAKSMEN